ncbi:protein of unknown function [Paraburkholderia dioscoreae]|uniref:Uncharacterized protein n=1 Tax=Paraburkholderia dioscoreae TaxID=2604047 RepID=A0A5Q4ZQ26_9BURK|nr:protein of unknown function [Paraburkholderia dioscoreae]
MRRGGERGKRVHFEAQVERRAGRRMACYEVERAVLADREFAEEVDVGDEIACAEAVLRQFEQQAVAAVADHRVAMLLITGHAVFAREQFRVADPAERIVPAERIGRDRSQHATHVRVEHVAARQMRGVLRLQRIGHVVAFERFVVPVEHGGQIRAAFAIDDAQRHATAQHAGPVRAGGNHRFPRHMRDRCEIDWDLRRHGGSRYRLGISVRGRLTDIATSRAFIPPWSLAGALREGERQDRIALGPGIVHMKAPDRNPSDPEDDANYFAPLGVQLSELCASVSSQLRQVRRGKGLDMNAVSSLRARRDRSRTSAVGGFAPVGGAGHHDWAGRPCVSRSGWLRAMAWCVHINAPRPLPF